MEFKQPKAIYVQIADYLLDNILSGEIKGGERLASVRELATSVQVNPNTVVRSYNYLQEQEIIYQQRGIGYFVVDDGLQKTRAFRRKRFFEQFLPDVFKSMDLLGISMEEIVETHKKQKV
ncbi:MAG: GntR family transcriptional regulator [Saprospiraceae bacterium]|nr:GntR family transcriptional regulator [Saprospiraceae bacterium]